MSGVEGMEHDDGSPEARVAASLADAQAGRVTRHASAQALMEHLEGEQKTVGWVRPEAVTRHDNGTKTRTTARLGDVADSMKNGLYKPASEYGEDGVPCLRMYNIDAGQIVWRDIKRMRVTASELEDYGLVEGDLLVNRVNSRELVGKTALIPLGMEPSVFESKNIRLRLKTDQALPKFINYQLLAFGRQHFSNNAQQVVGMASVSQKQLADFPIVLAPIDQQKHIVAEIEKQFSRLDEAVANLKRVKANLKRYKAAVLKVAVEGKLTEAWRKQHPDTEPASELLQRIFAERRAKWEQAELAKMQAKGKAPKDDAWKKKYPELAAPDTTDLPELPEGWQWVSWEKVLDFEVGAFKRGPFGSALTKAIFVESGYKVYEQYCPINDDPSFARYFVTEKKYKEMEGFAVKAGDFLISCSGVTLGRITHIPEDYEPGIINQALLRVRLNNSLIDDGYFLRLFRSPYFQKRIFDNSQGAAIPNVKGVKELKAIPIPLPPIEEQMALSSHIDEQMSIIANAVQQVDANVKRAERLRQSTLSRAFSNSFRPNPMNPNKD